MPDLLRSVGGRLLESRHTLAGIWQGNLRLHMSLRSFGCCLERGSWCAATVR